MTGGRAAWNVVTSLNDGEARNMGRGEVMEHDLRYDRADEFMEVVLGPLESVGGRCAGGGQGSGLSRIRTKCRGSTTSGSIYASRGPFTVPRTPQGHPVVIQAGQSGRGRRFAGRWGEMIFSASPGLESGKQSYAALKGEAAAAGRDPEREVVCKLVLPVVAASKAEAEDKMALAQSLPLDIDQLSLLSEALNFDFATRGLDEPLADEDLAHVRVCSRSQTGADASGKRNPTVREFMHYSKRGRPDDAIVGGPKEVADTLEEEFRGAHATASSSPPRTCQARTRTSSSSRP